MRTWGTVAPSQRQLLSTVSIMSLAERLFVISPQAKYDIGTLLVYERDPPEPKQPYCEFIEAENRGALHKPYRIYQ